MISRSLLITVAAGLAAGAAVGSITFRGNAGPNTFTLEPQRGNHDRVQQVADVPGLRLDSFDDGERISRVFSALQQPVRLRMRYELFEALRDLTAKDLPALVKHVESLPQATRSGLLPPLLERWFELDPNAAQTWAMAHTDDWELLKVWARADPEGAFRIASESKEAWAFPLIRGALDGLYGKDMAAKVARAKTLPPGQSQAAALAVALLGWAEQNPSAAYAALPEIPPSLLRDSIRQELLRTWAEKDPGGALKKVGEILPTLSASVLGNDLVTQVVVGIAAKDPKLALEWLSGVPEEFRWSPSIAVARQWAQKEPVAALEWCMANGVDIAQANWRDYQRWDPSVLGGAMERAPAETFARLTELPAGEERDRLLECAFMESLWHTPRKQLFEGDDALAWRFFNQLPEDAQIAKAALFGEKRAELEDLSDLGAWGQNFQPGPVRANAIAGAIGTAFQRDGANVEALLATVSAPADRDAALFGLTRAMRNGAPADAAERAMEIGDTTMRQEALEGVVLPWLKSDPAASRSWLQKTGTLPEAWKTEWLARSRAKDSADG